MARQIINVGNKADDGKGDKLRVAFQKTNANFTELFAAAGIMSQQIINIGNVPDDGKGDKLRVAFEKVNANFAELYAGGGGGGTFTISVTAAPSEGGSVVGGGTFPAGTSQTVTATANSGYAFVNWTVSGTIVSTSAAYTFTLTANITLVANFSTSQVLLVIFTGESNAGGFASNTGTSPGVDSPTTAEMQPRAGVKILNNTTLALQSLQIGVNNLMGHNGLTDNATHGCELELANAVDAGRFNSTPLYLLKTGQGHSIIAEWAPSASNEYGVTSYWTTFLDRLSATQSAMAALGLSPVPVVFYSQGINDALRGTMTDTTTWKSLTIAHLARIRTALGGSSIPIVMTKFDVSTYAAYNAAIDSIVSGDPYTFSCTSEDSLLQVDTNHWTYLGYKVLCERFIDAWQAITGTSPTPTFSPPTGSYGSAQTVTIGGAGTLRYSLTAHDPFIGTVYSTPFTAAPPIGVSARNIVRGLASGFGAVNYIGVDSWNTSDVSAGGYALSNGNLDITKTVASGWNSVRTVVGQSAGKLYVEMKRIAGSGGNVMFGLANATFNASSYLGTSNYSIGCVPSGPNYMSGFTAGSGATLPNTAAVNDVYSLAVDFSAGKVWIALNNTWIGSGNPATGANPVATFVPATVGALFTGISIFDNVEGTFRLQPTAASFTYSPPSGFSAWN